MRKLLFAAPILGIALAACTVSVKTQPPTLTNVRTQSTYCTDKDTLVDWAFDYNGVVTRTDFAITDATVTDPTTQPAESRETVSGLSFVGGTVRGTYQLDTDGVPGYSGPLPASFSPNAIIVTPNKQLALWVRLTNAAGDSTWVKGNVMTPGTGAGCDPNNLDL
jgi:hypothetical protein